MGVISNNQIKFLETSKANITTNVILEMAILDNLGLCLTSKPDTYVLEDRVWILFDSNDP